MRDLRGRVNGWRSPNVGYQNPRPQDWFTGSGPVLGRIMLPQDAGSKELT
jgi:hypothetical protein